MFFSFSKFLVINNRQVLILLLCYRIIVVNLAFFCLVSFNLMLKIRNNKQLGFREVRKKGLNLAFLLHS